jgi:predicted Zn-dependent protease
LNHDPAQVDALRMQGDWLIDEDKTGDAIITLRKALDQEPDNALVLATLARAYEREGSQDLMSDVLMRAVESASYDPTLTLQMVEVLRTQGQLPAAENLTLEALRRQNANLQLLGTLTEIHIAMEDWGRVTQDIHRLRQLRSDAAAHLADQLEGQQLIQRRKTKELMQFVENQLDNDTTGAAMVIRSMILDNQMAEAADYAKAAYTAQPEDPVASFLYATTLGHIHQDAEAIALFRSLVTDDPTLRDAWMAMYNLHQRAGEMKTALSVIEEALDHLPQDAGLKWIHASHMQAIGETDQAIAIYEDLYAQDSGQEMIANNLASLLSTERDDTDSLNRAYLIARRLQGSTYPPYQDTYGWIALKRGEVAQALEHLEPAASALNGDPTVQYHLGMAYVAAGQAQSAQTTLVYASALLMDHQDEMPELQAQVTAALASLAAAPSEIVTE